MTNVLVNVLGLLAIAPALTTRCPVWVPVARPFGFSDTLVEALGGTVPEVGRVVIHSVSGVALQLNVPPPAFEIPIAKVLGAVLPTNAVSVRALGDTDNCGGGVILKSTGTLTEGPVHPLGDTVIVSR